MDAVSREVCINGHYFSPNQSAALARRQATEAVRSVARWLALAEYLNAQERSAEVEDLARVLAKADGNPIQDRYRHMARVALNHTTPKEQHA